MRQSMNKQPKLFDVDREITEAVECLQASYTKPDYEPDNPSNNANEPLTEEAFDSAANALIKPFAEAFRKGLAHHKPIHADSLCYANGLMRVKELRGIAKKLLSGMKKLNPAGVIITENDMDISDDGATLGGQNYLMLSGERGYITINDQCKYKYDNFDFEVDTKQGAKNRVRVLEVLNIATFAVKTLAKFDKYDWIRLLSNTEESPIIDGNFFVINERGYYYITNNVSIYRFQKGIVWI